MRNAAISRRLDEALQTAHFPEDAADVPRALDRLAFDELLALQLGLAQARKARDDLTAPAIRVTDADLAEIIGALPFTLTGDQSAAVEAIAEDLASERPMRRLLQGDVGSGKTAVAAVALASAVRAGWQGALMAPTEILARQHHAGLAPLLDGLGVRSEFLSGSLTAKRKREIHDAIAGGMAEVVIGTHAVISEAVEFPRLGLAIVDEQHRFGVGQRAALQAKGAGGEPHTLALTATPIPRTLALTVYGDLSISTIREMPPGRQPIRTEIRDRRALPKIEEFLAAEAAEGRQSFVVAPLVVESETLEAASAEAEAERLQAALPGVRVGLVHGQQRADVRDATMTAFAAGESDVLVATTVIEVGIDVPNASVMLIEDAERFGLAQLHQLRGRVGRGPHRSFCILLSDSTDPLALERLEVVRGSLDGFHIAEEDLRLRGAGNLLGTRQSGLPPLKVASLFEPRHLRLAERARDLADGLVATDPELQRRPELARMQADFAPVTKRATRPDARHRRDGPWRAAHRAARLHDPADHRPSQGDPVRDPRRPRARGPRPRPLRGQRGDRDRGAVSRRRSGRLRRARRGAPSGRCARTSIRRGSRRTPRSTSWTSSASSLRRRANGTSSCWIHRTRCVLSWRRFAPSCHTWLPAHRS